MFTQRFDAKLYTTATERVRLRERERERAREREEREKREGERERLQAWSACEVPLVRRIIVATDLHQLFNGVNDQSDFRVTSELLERIIRVNY